jgi:hypothetical protein
MDRHEQMRQAAQRYHQKNPEVWEYFVKFTMDRINRGFKKYSARGVFHRIRWETAFPTEDPQGKGFRISNNHSPYYAREFMKRYPQYQGFFNTSELPSKGAKPK